MRPCCRRCVDTGRTCDGYESPFRFYINRSSHNTRAHGSRSGSGARPIEPNSTKISPQDVDLLSRYFHTKTIFDVDLGCNEDARQILLASLTDPSIRHAITSLKALRENFEKFASTTAQPIPSHYYGLQQYCMALNGLAFNLSSLPSPSDLKSALLCCQIFISIEQVRENYAVMAQHIMHALKIMRDARVRPCLDAANRLVPAHHKHLPVLDVFIIKLFAAPCGFAEGQTGARCNGTTVSVDTASSKEQSFHNSDLRTIAPDMRAELVGIAASTLEYLKKVFRVQSAGDAIRLLSKKRSLLTSLESWLADLELTYMQNGLDNPEPLPVSFMRFFYQILKVVLLSALESSQGLDAELQTENEQLQNIASNVGKKVKAYRMCH